MKKYLILFLSLFLFSTSFAFATAKINLGLNLGSMTPDGDSLIIDTFGNSFYNQFQLGLLDYDNGWEIRGNLGHYHESSHHPLDIGTDLKINITTLTGSLIYNLGGGEPLIQPYIGAGGGAYFYGIEDNIFGNLESGTKFGLHLLGGIKLNILNNFSFNLEYNKHYIPAIFFNNSENFDSSIIIFGGTFYFPLINKQKTTSRYSSFEERLLIKIDNLTSEIKEMKTKKTEIENEIDKFYNKQHFSETTGFLKSLNNNEEMVSRTIKILEPNTKTPLAAGTIHLVKKESNQIKVLLKHDLWTTDLLIKIDPVKVKLSDKTYNGFTRQNINDLILVNTIQNELEFAKEFRATKYFESKLDHLNNKISAAEKELASIQTQWQHDHQDNVTIQQHIVYLNRGYSPYGYNPGHYSGRYNPNPVRNRSYSYYQPNTYVVQPRNAPSRPSTVKEKQEYAQKKKVRIENLKNRSR